ncbi:hypothetical protein D3Z36_14605 [Lachnospiraceae bacterium]|nr:hypothetical protein [Lachnospiraceae bacterium]
MKEKCVKKLEEWFGGNNFDYEIINTSDGECIFVTISEDCGERVASLYRVFKLGDGLEISRDYEQSISNNNASILSVISEMMKVYKRVLV